jgi:hypothetical protein
LTKLFNFGITPVTKRDLNFAYEKKRRASRIIQTCVTVAVFLLLAAYLYHAGFLSSAKIMGIAAGR